MKRRHVAIPLLAAVVGGVLLGHSAAQHAELAPLTTTTAVSVTGQAVYSIPSTTNTTLGAVPVTAQVKRVVDGDTLYLTDGTEIRLIGVDTPETVKPRTPVQCYGPEASEHLKELLPPGTSVRIEYDSRRRLDRYGRTLAYVYKDTLFINDEAVLKGFARADYVPPTRDHRQEFQDAQAKAQAEHKGFWNPAVIANCKQHNIAIPSWETP